MTTMATMQRLLAEVEKKVETTRSALLGGMAKDWTEYRSLVARLQAFKEVAAIALDQDIKSDGEKK